MDYREAERRDDRRREQRPREQREREERAYQLERKREEERQREERERKEAESGSLFGDLKRAAGVDTNKFAIKVSYNTFSGGETSPKLVEIKQDESFEKMFTQPFFDDLVRHGPLLIYNLDISSEHTERTYHVHKKLLKTLESAAHKLSLKDLSVSIIKSLNINLRFDEKSPEDATALKTALTKIAAKFNILYEHCRVNDESADNYASEKQATAVQVAALDNVFAENVEIRAANGKLTGQYRAAFGTNTSVGTSVVAYQAFVTGEPAHFANATLVENPGGGNNYRLKWDLGHREAELPYLMFRIVGAGKFFDLQQILVPAHKLSNEARYAPAPRVAEPEAMPLPPALPTDDSGEKEVNPSEAPEGGEASWEHTDAYWEGERPHGTTTHQTGSSCVLL